MKAFLVARDSFLNCNNLAKPRPQLHLVIPEFFPDYAQVHNYRGAQGVNASRKFFAPPKKMCLT